MADQSSKTTRKIGYARVSTHDQNPELQIEALKRAGVSEDLIFVDRASGGTMDRPNLKRALKTAQHPGSQFVVWKLDRLGRTLGGVLEVLKMLKDRDIAFRSLTEDISTGGPMGKAMIHLLAVFAELERDLIRERTLAGLERARAAGRKSGRARSMTPERLDRARELLAEGVRGAEVWRELQKIDGPPISRAAYYAWQNQHDEAEKLGLDDDKSK